MSNKQRDILELIPGKHKTVLIDQSPIRYVLGGLICSAIGLGVLWCISKAVQQSLAKHDATGVVMALVFGILFGGIFVFAGVLSFYVVYDSRRSLSLESLSARLHVSEENLRQVAQEKGIVPRYSVLGHRVYRPGAFASMSLVRASIEPVQEQESVLLRAATAGVERHEEQLIRASAGTERTQGLL